MTDFYIAQNDTSPALQVQALQFQDGPPIDVTGAVVRFHMRQVRAGSAVVVDAPAVIVSGPDGKMRYDWQAVDTAQAGTFLAEFEITYLDGRIETVPNVGFITVSIRGDIA